MDHVRDREHDAGTSSTSHDVTLTDAASDRIGETAQSEKQGVDASPPSQNEMKDGNSKASLIVVTLAIIMTGMMIFMDLTILVTVGLAAASGDALLRKRMLTRLVRQYRRSPQYSTHWTISVGTEMRTHSACMDALIENPSEQFTDTCRAVLIPLAGKLTRHFTAKVTP